VRPPRSAFPGVARSLPRTGASVIASLFWDGDRRGSARWIGRDWRLVSHGISLPTDGSPRLMSLGMLVGPVAPPSTLIKRSARATFVVV
jgi:hypothetical protein